MQCSVDKWLGIVVLQSRLFKGSSGAAQCKSSSVCSSRYRHRHRCMLAVWKQAQAMQFCDWAGVENGGR